MGSAEFFCGGEWVLRGMKWQRDVFVRSVQRLAVNGRSRQPLASIVGDVVVD